MLYMKRRAYIIIVQYNFVGLIKKTNTFLFKFVQTYLKATEFWYYLEF